jgi:beta-glucosidase
VARDDPFPQNFLWGAATSAYQIEGSPLDDGAGPSIWHRFAHTPGTIRDGGTGDVACDHYRRFREDVALMRELGLNAYRFSVAWARVVPEGTGAVNSRGLDHYERLVDELLANGIQPMATLYHWDLPASLDDRGGWLNPDMAQWFAEYSRAVFRRLDDRVRLWATINEPWVVVDGGYLHGVLAPGHRSPYEAPRASHNLLRAHAASVAAYRAEGRHQIGLVVNVEPKYPASPRAEDVAATQRADAYMNRQYLDAALQGRYPEELPEIFRDAWPGWSPEEVRALRAPGDFIGVNYYTRCGTRADPESWPLEFADVREGGARHTETGWEVYARGLEDTLSWVKQRYGDVPLYVTENGAAFPDPPQAPAGGVEDPLRVDYLREHLRALRDALADGCDVRGYFVWSLLDNLEWAHGFSKRFGIVHVDFASQRRTPKTSARFYASVIASNGRLL